MNYFAQHYLYKLLFTVFLIVLLLLSRGLVANPLASPAPGFTAVDNLEMNNSVTYIAVSFHWTAVSLG